MLDQNLEKGKGYEAEVARATQFIDNLPQALDERMRKTPSTWIDNWNNCGMAVYGSVDLLLLLRRSSLPEEIAGRLAASNDLFMQEMKGAGRGEKTEEDLKARVAEIKAILEELQRS
ncbi:MAG: hypothetical protein V4438_01245 [Patescibacteria group bacterium]